MHDMAVTFNNQQIAYLNGSTFGHPAYIVSSQVNQHQVLGPLLGISEQLFFKGLVFLRGSATFSGTGNGTQLNVTIFKSNQDLR